MTALSSSQSILPKPRTIIYIDGFNLYYGAVKGTPYKWLDLAEFFRLLRPHDSIQKIRYFTALITGPTKPNQETYWQALATTPIVDVILGKFKNKRVVCGLPACSHPGKRVFEVPEEKRTDVNIAVYMLDDAYQDACDNLVLVSGDSDLVPAVRMIRTRFPAKRITVYVPAQNPVRSHAVELRSSAHKHRDLPLNLLPKAQFDAAIPDGMGGHILKPAAW
jgi:6-hydroxy-3-succinoylpyridine 3-monooxygenase